MIEIQAPPLSAIGLEAQQTEGQIYSLAARGYLGYLVRQHKIDHSYIDPETGKVDTIRLALANPVFFLKEKNKRWLPILERSVLRSGRLLETAREARRTQSVGPVDAEAIATRSLTTFGIVGDDVFMKITPNGEVTILPPNYGEKANKDQKREPIAAPQPVSEPPRFGKLLLKPGPENPFPGPKQKETLKEPSLARRLKDNVKFAAAGIGVAIALATAVLPKPGIASAAPSETSSLVDQIPQLQSPADDKEEVPTMSYEDFIKWSNRFPKDTRRALSDLVTLDKGAFDGRVATEVASMEKKLNSGRFSFSLSPHMVNEFYAKYIAECENNPSDFWQDIIDQVGQDYISEIRDFITGIDLSNIQPSVQPSTQPQVKEPASDSTESIKTEAPKIIDFGDRIPNPDFNKILKHSVILDSQEDFVQILVLQEFNAGEIEKFKVLLKFGTLISSYSDQDTIFEILREAAKKNLALSPAQVATGLQFVQKNNINLGFLDAVELYIYLLQFQRK